MRVLFRDFNSSGLKKDWSVTWGWRASQVKNPSGDVKNHDLVILIHNPSGDVKKHDLVILIHNLSRKGVLILSMDYCNMSCFVLYPFFSITIWKCFKNYLQLKYSSKLVYLLSVWFDKKHCNGFLYFGTHGRPTPVQFKQNKCLFKLSPLSISSSR